MTSNQVELLHLGILPIDDRACLLVESAICWIDDNTTLNIDPNCDAELQALPAPVKLFILRYIDVMCMTAGVTSESIEGLSHSFDSDNKSALLWQYADELLSKWIVSPCRFVQAKKRW